MPRRTNSGRSTTVRTTPTIMHSSHAGKNVPWISMIGSQPASTKAAQSNALRVSTPARFGYLGAVLDPDSGDVTARVIEVRRARRMAAPTRRSRMARFVRAVKESCRRGCGALLATTLLGACALPPALKAGDPMPLAPDAPDQSWTPPEPASELRAPADAWRASGQTLPRQADVYDLPAIVDIALRNNPETRRSWEDARTAAA